MIDSSLWTGRPLRDKVLRFGFRGRNQAPLFMAWWEYWNVDHTDVQHATAFLVIDSLVTAPKVCWQFLKAQWWRYWVYNDPMSRCKVCGSKEAVAFYDPRGLWAYFFRNTLCPGCCKDHDFAYSSDVCGHTCQYCGAPAPDDWYYFDEPF